MNLLSKPDVVTSQLMAVFILTLIIVGLAFAMIGVRSIFLKGGEFRGTCATNNPMLAKEGVDCPVCGAAPEETCKKDKNKTPEEVFKQLEG